MKTDPQAAAEKNPEREWTIMIHFASDNPLAPNVVSQLKSIKSAGFHQNVNVVAQFDPYIPRTPTHVFEVNGINKIKKSYAIAQHPRTENFEFWKGNDPYIRNLVLDRLWNADETEGPIRAEVIKYLQEKCPGTPFHLPVPQPNGDNGPHGYAECRTPKESLQQFLDFCATEYPARHYMLFLLGHGLVVGGSSMFLYDANAATSSLNLKDFGEVLRGFKGKRIELLGLHSCSMSALEVACEVQDSVNYVIASQGTEYVGSWPYREILIRVFNDVIWQEESQKQADPLRTIERIYAYILNNAYDFQMAGYSFDLCLCDVRKLEPVTDALRTLSQLLIKGLNLMRINDAGEEIKDPLITERILLAHWDAQSFWQETYTDLADFCYCLRRRCEQVNGATPQAARLIERIIRCCTRLSSLLEKKTRHEEGAAGWCHDGPIVRADFAGPECQYSTGLSVYFPWSSPIEDFWPAEYQSYRFNNPDENDSHWVNFLIEYFKQTRREPIGDQKTLPSPSLEHILLEVITDYCFENDESGLLRSLGLKRKSKAGLGQGEKPFGSTGLGQGEKPFGSTGLGQGEKPFGSTGLGQGEKPFGSTGLGQGEKPFGSTGLGQGEKPFGSTGLGQGEKPFGSTGLGQGGEPIGSSGLEKPFGSAGVGGDCDCPAIKNYPRFTLGGKRPTSPEFFRVIDQIFRESK